MQRHYLICILVFSLALNLGGLTTFGYLRHQDRGATGEPQPFQEIWAALHLEAEQRQVLIKLLPEHRRRVRELRLGLAGQRGDLHELVKEGRASWPAMQDKVREISSLQGQLEEEVLRFCLTFREHLKPEQKTAFLTFIDRRLLNIQGAKGRGTPGWGRGKRTGPPMNPQILAPEK